MVKTYEDAIFEYFFEVFDGMGFNFRLNKNTGEVDMMLDDNYAKVNGLDSLRQFFEKQLGYHINDTLYNHLVSALKWIRVDENGLRPIIVDSMSFADMNRKMGEA